MKVVIENGDWPSRAAQETVRKHFANATTVELEFSKPGQRSFQPACKKRAHFERGV